MCTRTPTPTPTFDGCVSNGIEVSRLGDAPGGPLSAAVSTVLAVYPSPYADQPFFSGAPMSSGNRYCVSVSEILTYKSYVSFGVSTGGGFYACFIDRRDGRNGDVLTLNLLSVPDRRSNSSPETTIIYGVLPTIDPSTTYQLEFDWAADGTMAAAWYDNVGNLLFPLPSDGATIERTTTNIIESGTLYAFGYALVRPSTGAMFSFTCPTPAAGAA
jgi:hypothetical protein